MPEEPEAEEDSDEELSPRPGRGDAARGGPLATLGALGAGGAAALGAGLIGAMTGAPPPASESSLEPEELSQASAVRPPA